MTGAVALAAKDVTVRFGGFQALTGVSIDFAEGEVTALIGPNGAGKTTLMNVLSGLSKPSSGTVELGGRDIGGLGASRRAALGIARSFQIISVYPDMTVLENVRLGMQRSVLSVPVFWRGIGTMAELERRTVEHLERFRLAHRRDEIVANLSHGEQRTLELAVSLAGDPKVLLLDEPLAGVGRGETGKFMPILRQAMQGRTTVIVEHNMAAVLELADTIVCLVRGTVLSHARPDEIRGDPRVRAAYLGEDASC